ncbi:MAG TPA: plasmid stabilization protein [Gammaproteobacteria bacterium]|nr:plasmid stabilization protein [Gammaproteobacteria bacterium]
MANITIHDIDNTLAERLKAEAARHGRSVEDEARDILRASLSREGDTAQGLGSALHELFRPLGGADLDIPPREPMREPPQLD